MTLHPLERGVHVGPGGALPALEQLDGKSREWHAAMPYTRLTDYGMEPADARELLWRTARGENWSRTARAIGTRQLARADGAHALSHGRTELVAVQAGAAALNIAQIPLSVDTDLKRNLYWEFQDAVARYAAVRGGMERVSVRYAAAAVDGWLVLPRSGPPYGAVVAWGGLSGWGAAYLGIAEELTARGIACLLAEGPGQGTTRLESSIYASEETLGGYARFVDVLETDPRTCSAPIGIYGSSIGGMIAARVASSDPRIRACAINCAPAAVDLPDAAGPRDQLLAFMGLRDQPDEAREAIRRLSFDPHRHQLGSSLLVLHGGADALVDRGTAGRFMPPRPTEESADFLSWPDGEHTLYNHSRERDTIVADWFADRLSKR
ncbi:MAG: alpha/beta hydrolase family protein [Microbacterium sp.]|uniref:alpha/beta hydrolase family protein n=1 Tax=Microbacterium sp. TaxID=51671 RepID=UPI003F7FE291